jgi:DNA-binding NarL/FixJ family response regulator
MEKKSKILVVDNDPEFISELQTSLKGKGLQALTAINKMRAKEMMHKEKPDLIVLGPIAPRGEAFLLHQWIRQSQQFSDIPIIVIDAPPEKRLISGWRRDEGLRLEAEDYIFKPVDTSALITRVEKLLDKATHRIKVLVADDHEVVREGIRALMSLQKDMQVVGEAVDGKDAVEKALHLSPDIVLMDIVMPNMNGLEATKQIRKESDRVRVLILTQYDDEENALASKRVGAFGFISKRSASSELLAAIRSAQA